ncbi:MAG: hypothetical protein Q8L65_02370, partial [Burkholderiales bacterium]|nr:hypothetical protein [Burkholderiales bacterium]
MPKTSSFVIMTLLRLKHKPGWLGLDCNGACGDHALRHCCPIPPGVRFMLIKRGFDSIFATWLAGLVVFL